jgi:deoxycytidine triphosphate deaminase
MSLAGTEIKAALNSGAWTAYRDGKPITADELKIGSNSVDVTLSSRLLRVRPSRWFVAIDPHDPHSQSTEEIEIGENGFILYPEDFVLGCVPECFDCAAAIPPFGYFVPCYEGRSTCARIGLQSHMTAGFGDYGFGSNGECFTLELKAALPVILRAGMRIGQIEFRALSGHPDRYTGAYTQQIGPTCAVLGRERF